MSRTRWSTLGRVPVLLTLSLLLAAGTLLSMATPAAAAVGVNIGFAYCSGPMAATRFGVSTNGGQGNTLTDVANANCNSGTFNYGTNQSFQILLDGNSVASVSPSTDINYQIQIQVNAGSHQLASSINPGNTLGLSATNNSYDPGGIYFLIVSQGDGPPPTPTPVPNRAPVLAGPSSLNATEDVQTTTSSFSATDADNNTVTFSVSDPAHGTASISSSGGAVTYKGDSNYNGPDSFIVTATDSKGAQDTITVTVSVAAVNDAPVATSQSFSVVEDGQHSIILGATDVDSSTLTYTITVGPAHGTLSSGTGAGRTYTPNVNYFGPDSFTFTASDGSATSNTATVSITVTSVNDPPTATGDTLAASDEDVARTIATSELTGNDVAGPANEAQTLTVTSVDQAVGGMVSLSGTTITFTPTPNFNGPATFRYTIADDGNATAQATVSFTISSVNDAPVIDDASVPVNQTLEATGPDGAIATFTPPTATDVDTGDVVSVVCDRASGSTFPIKTTTVTCNATDPAGATDTVSFAVTVEDTTAPIIDEDTIPGVPTTVGSATINVLVVEATGPMTTVTWDAVTASDIVDGTIDADCTRSGGVSASGTSFALGDTTVTCDATDVADNTSEPVSFIVRVQDTTAPVITVPGTQTVEATSQNGAVVTYTVSASDLVDGPLTPSCTPASGSTFKKGTTTVTCTVTDAAGNTATETFSVRVTDTTGPTITLVGGPQSGATYSTGNVPSPPTCTTSDAGSVVIQCQVYGYSTEPGRNTLTIRARDADGNASISTLTYTVVAGSPATATPRPATATPRPATATPTRPVRPTVTPVAPIATPGATRPPRR